MVRDRNTHGDPDSDDPAVVDPEASSKSLGEHRRGRDRDSRCPLDPIHRADLQFHDDDFLLFVLWNDGSALHLADRVVRMEMDVRRCRTNTVPVQQLIVDASELGLNSIDSRRPLSAKSGHRTQRRGGRGTPPNHSLQRTVFASRVPLLSSDSLGGASFAHETNTQKC